ncbi:hypothetical protein [Streptomyces sp. SAI-129]|uniref:hypothetical protein n=1 Tax=Streptomyces sp. SAI-129 TaxID=3377727 RepID=UPI003C7D0260
MKLADLAPLMERRQDGGMSFDCFRNDPALLPLRWPDDVLEQVLFDHGDNPSSVYDYGAVDLREIIWRLETISASELCEMPTGASDGGCIDHFARNPEHWIKVRPAPVGRHWEEHGTWLRAPILISASCWTRPARVFRYGKAGHASVSSAAAVAGVCMSHPTIKLGSAGLEQHRPARAAQIRDTNGSGTLGHRLDRPGVHVPLPGDGQP